MQGLATTLAFALALGMAAGTPPAAAATLYTQPLALPNGDPGPFSFAGQQIADQFRLGAETSVAALVWYGDNVVNSFPGGMSFTVRLFDSAGTRPVETPFYSQAVTATAVATESIVQGRSVVFRFSANLPGPVLLGGETDYWLSILDNSTPGPLVQFRWANGASAGSDDPNAFRFADGAPWNRMFSLDPRAQAAYDLLDAPILPVPVPEPGGLTLIGLGLAGAWLAGRRRGIRFYAVPET